MIIKQEKFSDSLSLRRAEHLGFEICLEQSHHEGTGGEQVKPLDQPFSNFMHI